MEDKIWYILNMTAGAVSGQNGKKHVVNWAVSIFCLPPPPPFFFCVCVCAWDACLTKLKTYKKNEQIEVEKTRSWDKGWRKNDDFEMFCFTWLADCCTVAISHFISSVHEHGYSTDWRCLLNMAVVLTGGVCWTWPLYWLVVFVEHGHSTDWRCLLNMAIVLTGGVCWTWPLYWLVVFVEHGHCTDWQCLLNMAIVLTGGVCWTWPLYWLAVFVEHGHCTDWRCLLNMAVVLTGGVCFFP